MRRAAFFYGLFMDPAILNKRGVSPGEGRRARVDGHALRIGERATLVPEDGAHALGMAYALEASQLQALYSADGLEAYTPTLVQVQYEDGTAEAAECWVLAQAPEPGERNPDYASRLRETLEKLDFPGDYIAAIA
jgi:hypothetical protein